MKLKLKFYSRAYDFYIENDEMLHSVEKYSVNSFKTPKRDYPTLRESLRNPKHRGGTLK